MCDWLTKQTTIANESGLHLSQYKVKYQRTELVLLSQTKTNCQWVSEPKDPMAKATQTHVMWQYLLSCELSAVWTSRLLLTAANCVFNLSMVSFSWAFSSRFWTVISVEATATQNATDYRIHSEADMLTWLFAAKHWTIEVGRYFRYCTNCRKYDQNLIFRPMNTKKLWGNSYLSFWSMLCT